MDNEADIPLYPIRTAAKKLNVSVHTLRMYEREGLIIPHKKESKHRLYSQSDINRLHCIRRLITDLKIGINGIKILYSLIPCWKIIGCSVYEKNNCEASKAESFPCWMYLHQNNICTARNCRECPVYLNYSECVSIKQILTEDTK